MPNPVPLPIHFKLPGRSYSQIGRKGNVALYSVYSDYLVIPNYALPYALIGFELITIRTFNGRERYPFPRQFGRCAWSIPKSFPRTRPLNSRRSSSGRRQHPCSALQTFPDRSTSTQVSAHLAQPAESADQTPSEDATYATITPQRRVTLLKGQL
jgi:hypothetical protein